MTRIVAIIQARMASSRLPGKVLLDIEGQPMLARTVERARRARTVERVVVATTIDPSDDAVAALCAQRGYLLYRGSMHDVLDRYYQAASAFQAEVVVRITADCPLLDPDLVDATVCALWGQTWSGTSSALGAVQETVYDFTTNRLPPPWGRTYPIGLDTEVCTFAGLERAWREADQPHQREHVMPYFYEQPGRYRIYQLNHDMDYGALRWTVDTSEDLAFARAIYAHFKKHDDFTWLDVLALLQREPELAKLNSGVQHKKYDAVDERFRK